MLVTFGLPFSVRYLSDPCFIHQIFWFLRLYVSSIFYCSGNVSGWIIIYYLRSIDDDSAYKREGGQGHVGGKNFCAGTIYGPKTRPYTKSQSGSQSHRGHRRRALWMMIEYDLAKAILILTLTQPRMCEVGSSCFSTMSWIKSWVQW